jgi:hypothetical protein
MLIVTGLIVCAVSPLLVAQQSGPGPDVKVVRRSYDMQALVRSAAVPLTESQRKGRTLWVQRCAFCHDGVGTPTYNTLGPYLDAELVARRGDSAVRGKILKGSSTMPAFEWALKPGQADQLISFLKTIGPEQKPTDAQKAGKAKSGADL